MSIVAALVPFRFHLPMKSLIWDVEERDTFPICYRMNTRKTLAYHFGNNQMSEVYFQYLDDCCTTNKFRSLNTIELGVRKIFNKLGFRYPESCVLGIYKKL